MPSIQELEDWAVAAEEIAVKAGAILLKGREEGYEIMSKGGVDLVTAVDQASEKLILDFLTSKYPDHDFIGEESASNLPSNEDGTLKMNPDQPTWLIDPLDGTTNYVTGQNDSVVSIAVAVNGKPVVGVVYNPFLDELYSATHGGGAYCNGKKITVGTASDIGQLVVMNNIGACRDLNFLHHSVAMIQKLLEAKVRGMRCGGSCAMNMCYVAANRMGVYYECGFGGPWDPAAAAVIVTEAGGVVLDAPSGGAHRLMAGPGNVLCGHPDACKTVSDIISSAKVVVPVPASAPAPTPPEPSLLDRYALQIAGLVTCAALVYAAFRKQPVTSMFPERPTTLVQQLASNTVEHLCSNGKQ